ncbi:lipocalin-like domain-containing protein (plasmid) [Pseudomonas sp. App30]|uniref:lipocalin-like domain-containing protein n=1 Tax=Pseudomonas sp. App30 TaxID=3068990 RepID=UPI003A802F74
MSEKLFDQLIGAWKLVSYVEEPVDGSPAIQPFGMHPQGIIMYTPDGYMSAQLMNPQRIAFASGDWFDGTAQEYESEATTYIAYSGKFEVDEAKRTLTHSMYVSLFPNWLGQTQPRVIDLDRDVLRLSPAAPIRSRGRLVSPYLEWHRAAAR